MVQKLHGVVFLSMAMIFGASARPIEESAPSQQSEVIPVEGLRFYQNRQGLTVANAWGDPTTGPDSNYIRMPAKAKSGLPTHSFSYYGVVVSGVLANEPSDDGTARSLRPGSYWFQEATNLT